jgi:hypothetical protein
MTFSIFSTVDKISSDFVCSFASFEPTISNGANSGTEMAISFWIGGLVIDSDALGLHPNENRNEITKKQPNKRDWRGILILIY